MKRIAALLAATLGLAACGGGDGSPTTGATTTAAATTATAAGPGPEALGDQIGDRYLAAYDDLLAYLADRPEAAEAASDLAVLKEQYVQEMVALGRQREALDEAGRATVDARITAALGRLPAATYDAYQEAFTYYSSDLEVANLIAVFNVIGQYANFDLLRQQAPDEAARLGVG